jgi:caa(3)-type oxidase subunit IV
MHDAHSPSDASEPSGEGHGESHLPTYNRVIVLLATLTAVEFGIAYWMKADAGLPFVVGVLALLALAGWKAVWVARFFMHLKYDPSSLAFLALIPLILGAPIVVLVGYDLVKGPNF